MQEIYSAYLGEDAFMNDRRIHVSDTTDITKALISLQASNLGRSDYHEGITNLLTHTRVRARMGLSSVIEATHLAAGRVDLLTKFNQHIWDIAPQYRLMKEAGAVITNEYGEELTLDIRKGSKTNYIAVTKALLPEQLKELYLERG